MFPENKECWYELKQKLSKLRKGEIKVEISQPKILSFRNQLLVEFLQKYSSPDKEDDVACSPFYRMELICCEPNQKR